MKIIENNGIKMMCSSSNFTLRMWHFPVPPQASLIISLCIPLPAPKGRDS